MKNFNINCDNCKQKKSSDIVYYCSDCKIFFCEACEDNIGKIHKHCYYKMRNKKQYEGLKNSINTFGKFLDNSNISFMNENGELSPSYCICQEPKNCFYINVSSGEIYTKKSRFKVEIKNKRVCCHTNFSSYNFI